HPLTAPGAPDANSTELIQNLKSAGVPARWVQFVTVAPDGTAGPPFLRVEAYLRGYGWLPLNSDTQASGKQARRMFSRPADWIALARMPDLGTQGTGMVYLVRGQPGGAREMTA